MKIGLRTMKSVIGVTLSITIKELLEDDKGD